MVVYQFSSGQVGPACSTHNKLPHQCQALHGSSGAIHIQKLHRLSWTLIRNQLHETIDPKSSSMTCYTITTCWIKLTTSIKVTALKTFLYLFLPTLCPPTVDLSDLPPCFTKPVTECDSQPSASQLQQRIKNRNTFLTVCHILTYTTRGFPEYNLL